ncbi:MAG: 2-hydroxyglutaryl-CoA dehydratase [Desulfovibrio sp.]|uniref:acyl-CoA dehydratase activase n=1 Tax=Desulfovibrio sp. TaxID=885 RepID=UPI00135D42EB|nr:acyl-CoA dehydratase activase [Desulfovibrio sp.]MTJ92563.1 2-hydroxyglutaryl-CoA dehydratase [Desulfovibrio sp.]
MSPPLLYLGLDIGSTTVKLALLHADGAIAETRYCRHGTAVRATLASLLAEVSQLYPSATVRCAMTGSGALDLSNQLSILFVQELLATARAIAHGAPDTTVAVELGGEDAKLLYLGQDVELRMNESCAGGTGAFIDQMARLLSTDAGGLNDLASRHTTLYPIASRCGVFAKTDIVPLLNGGVSREDIAASIFQAVVEQTIGGLACGRPITGKVAFLGGPLHFLPELKTLFIKNLDLSPQHIAHLPHAQCTAAIGAAHCAISAEDSAQPHNLADLAVLAGSLSHTAKVSTDKILPGMFADSDEYARFCQRHATTSMLPGADISQARGPLYLGLDLGSTTVKAVLVDSEQRVLDSCYASNGGNPLQTLLPPLSDMLDRIPEGAWLSASGATGYGAHLAESALGVDSVLVETLAHFKAATRLVPEVSYVIDIGGQDMKCLKIDNGVISDVSLNEACSAGCGAFLESFARGLGLSMQEFVDISLYAAHPADLGSRCTVFMNSRVTQAQKDGLPIADIAAGLCYSVVRNALDKVLRIKNTAELGEHVVVQGGAFLNDALLCAMERTLGRHVHRPASSGLMGAYGAALEALEKSECTSLRSSITASLIRGLAMRTRSFRCRDCGNNCLLTETRFSHGSRHIAGNRCDRFSESRRGATVTAPNLIAWKNQRLFRYEPLSLESAPRGRLGIPRVLNVYAHYPFWFTLFTSLGFRVEVSPPTSRALFAAGLSSVPSQSVCYPAKLAHGHVLSLLESGIKSIFFPCIPREAQEFTEMCDSFSCPVACGYPQVVRENLPEIKDAGAVLHAPFVNLTHTASLVRNLCREFNLPRGEVRAAMRAARHEQAHYLRELRAEAEHIYSETLRNKGTMVVLAGRPYHTDPQVHHGLPDFIASLGAAVVSEDALPRSWISHRMNFTLRARNQWTYAARLYRAGLWACEADHGNARVELVQLTSFGCGIDAITADQMRELMRAHGKLYTLIKMDEGNALASARIRIRSLLAVSNGSKTKGQPSATTAMPVFSKRDAGTHTILVPQMAPLHLPFITEAIAGNSHTVRLLPTVSAEAVSLGQAYVNNDACYPAIVAIGQLLHTLRSDDLDPRRTALLLSQTCGPCRASNYPALLRKALQECGYDPIPVLTINSSGTESQPGLRPDKAMLWRMLLGMLAGDMLQRLSLFTGTYECTAGQTEDRVQHWLQTMSPVIRKGDETALRQLLPRLVRDFASIHTHLTPRPRVAVVGEILLTYHSDANNHIVEQIRQEGGEPLLPDFTNFMLYCLRDAVYDWRHQGGSAWSALGNSLVMRRIEGVRRYMRGALNTSPLSANVMPVAHIDDLARLGESVMSLGNSAGEGWLLPAEMLEFLEHGTSNILCLQPFGCLPNHVVGRGAFKAVRRQRSEANIMALDYDPGSSEANQLNRIRLFMAIAREKEKEREEAARHARHTYTGAGGYCPGDYWQ